MSTPKADEGFGVTAEDLRAEPWQADLAASTEKDCMAYYSAFNQKIKASSEAGNHRATNVYRLVGALASFCPTFDSDSAAFGAMMIDYQKGTRTLLPEDLTEADLDAIGSVLREILDSEFRARVADVLWVSKRKDYKAAQVAVDAYIEAAGVLESGEVWPPFAQRLQRAMQIGAKLGRLKAYHQKAIDAVEVAIGRHEATDEGLLCSRLMHLLRLDRVGDSKRCSRLSEELARRMEAKKNWHFAREYWQLKAFWDAKDGDVENVRLAHRQIADTYVKLAEDFTTAATPSFLGAAHWMRKAVHALRQVKADAADIEASHKRLLEYERRGMGEMKTLQIPLPSSPDFEKNVEATTRGAAAHVAGQKFEDAILRLAYVAEPTQPDELRKRIEENSSGGVFTQLIGATTVRSGGQTSDTKPPLASFDPKAREEAVTKEMYSQARETYWPTRVRLCIDPAREQIVTEHAARPIDLLFLVRDNPFIPSGRESLFLRGLHAGLHGDLVLALHLLVPQIENSIREIFIARGIITSKLESNDTQDERDLGWLLSRPEMANIFGKDMAFDLRGLLTERFGLNLRNDAAHGLLAESEMVTPGALYLWWLTLRLCCIPLILSREETKTK